MESKSGRLSRLKVRLFRRSPSPAARTSMLGPPLLAEEPLLSPASKTPVPATSAAHVSDGSEPGIKPLLSPERDLWLEALEMLSKETEQQIKKMGVGEPKQSISHEIDSLVKIAKARQEECEQKFWRFRVGNREIIIRDYAAQIVGWLQKIGDVAIKFAPPEASLPWAAIKSVMQITVIEDAQMCALLASVEKIVRIINRGRVYELVYTQDSTPGDALQTLQTALVELYSASLELLAGAVELFSKNTAARTVHAILNPDKTSGVISKFAGLETQLGYEAQACESRRSALTDAQSRDKMKDLTDLLRSLEAPLTRVDEGVSALLEHVVEKERLEVLEWVSALPYNKYHTTVKEARTPHTCEWLIGHKRFREWEDTSSSIMLWLQGSPGAGKTFLTSMVIDHVLDMLTSSLNHEGFAFFYCNRNEDNRRRPLSVLRSYVRQLSTVANYPGNMRKELRNLCLDLRLKGSDLTLDECENQLLDSLNLYPKTTIVLDALDECEPESRGQLIKVIESLLTKSTKPLKVFISSRPDGDIRERFLSRPNIEIQATENQGDIKKFVHEEIVKHRRWKHISLSLREDIINTLLDRSNGMFQWAYLQIKRLLELLTEADIRNELGRLPKDLKEAYDKIYNQIASTEHAKALVDRACMWVMSAAKPLDSAELLSAIRLDPSEDTFHLAEEVDEDLLLDLCRNLLVIDTQRKVWRFSYLSVTEYFEENHWSLLMARCRVARVCLVLLIETYKNTNSDDCQERKPSDVFDPNHRLQVYIRHHWITHVQTREGQDADPMLVRLLKAFLGSPNESSLQYRKWYRRVATDYQMPRTSVFHKYKLGSIAPENVALFTMCRFSIYALLLDWWECAEIDLTQMNSEGHNLLTIAAIGGCKSICENLVKRGLQVNLPLGDSSYGCALAAAAYLGRARIVRFLVQEAGADVNMALQSGCYGSALAAAACMGETEIIEFLVQEAGADVNMALQSGDYGSALAAAACMGRTQTVKFLVQESGADVNMLLQSGDYGSALAAAAYERETEIVKFLVQEAGANVDMLLQSGNYGSALAAAACYGGACYGGAETVKFLVQEAGADVNMALQIGDYGSALAAAACMGETEIIEFLVQEAGADVNMALQSGDYGSALAAAACMGDTEIVEFLVQEAGADVNMVLQSGYYGSALAAAAYGGKTETVKFLVQEARANINQQLQFGRFGSALAAAAHLGRKQCVELLIESGAEVNLKLENGDFGSALRGSWASISHDLCEWDWRNEERRRQEKAEVAELLQRHGATY